MSFSIAIENRPAGKASDVRAAGLIPGVVYGGGRKETMSVAVSLSAFEKMYALAGESSLIDIQLPGEKEMVKVLIQDVQLDPVRNVPTHVDFRQINMNEEMTTDVELVFTGEAPAVKALGGTLMKACDTVTVTCLPKDLVSEISVDLSSLVDFDAAIRVADLVLPSGVRVSDQADLLVAKVTPPLTEDELKAMEASTAPVVDLSAIEVEKKGKKEEEVAADAK